MQRNLSIPHLTQLIIRWKESDDQAFNHLMSIAYSRLHISARQALNFYGNNASVQATELVNELYLHLRQQKEVKFLSAQHFFAIASLKLRQILNSRYEKNTAKKRSGLRECISMAEKETSVLSALEIFILNDYLSFLEKIEPLNARIAEFKLLWGFNNQEIAEIMGLSDSTIRRKWNSTKALLAKKMSQHDQALQ